MATSRAAKKAPSKSDTATKVAPKKVANNVANKVAKKVAAKKPADARPRVFRIPFASVYPLYVQKVEKKGRTRAELDTVLAWLTGYEGASLDRVIEEKADLETFFARAPRMSPHARLVTGVVCGVRVEDVADPLMKKIRQMDKLVDELAHGKKLESILRRP